MICSIEEQYSKKVLDILKKLYILYGTGLWVFGDSNPIKYELQKLVGKDIEKFLGRITSHYYSEDWVHFLGYRFNEEFIEWISKNG